MSLTLGNNQTNLQWRNAINNAFTVLETVSGITYELSGQRPDNNTVLINELSAKAGKGLPLSGRVASLTISATADDSLIAELSGKAGKGTHFLLRLLRQTHPWLKKLYRPILF